MWKPIAYFLFSFGWFVGTANAFNSSRTAVLVILLVQLGVGIALLLKGRPFHWFFPGTLLIILMILSIGSFRPVLVDRLLCKYSSAELFSRVGILRDVASQAQARPAGLVSGFSGQGFAAGSHNLFGDLVLGLGLPFAFGYLLVLVFLLYRVWHQMRLVVSPNARAGLLLLLVIPCVQNLVNVNLLQPFSFFNTVYAALAIMLFAWFVIASALFVFQCAFCLAFRLDCRDLA